MLCKDRTKKLWGIIGKSSPWYTVAKSYSNYHLYIHVIKCLEKTRLLSDQVFAAVEHFCENKELNGVCWLLLKHWGT